MKIELDTNLPIWPDMLSTAMSTIYVKFSFVETTISTFLSPCK